MDKADKDSGYVWDLHAVRDKSKKSVHFLDEKDLTVKAALAPMIAAAGPSFALKPRQKDGVRMMFTLKEVGTKFKEQQEESSA